MIRRIPSVGSLIACLVVAASVSFPATAAEKTAAELLPSTVAIYAELPQAKQLLATVLDHPLRQKLEALDDYRKAYASPQYAQLQQQGTHMAMPMPKQVISGPVSGQCLVAGGGNPPPRT